MRFDYLRAWEGDTVNGRHWGSTVRVYTRFAVGVGVSVHGGNEDVGRTVLAWLDIGPAHLTVWTFARRVKPAPVVTWDRSAASN